MHQRFTSPLLLLFLFALSSSSILYGQVQNVDVSMDVIEVRHNYDCGSDGDGLFAGTPEPRWKFWGGYDGGSWSFVGTHKYAFDGGALNCGIWNHSDFDLRNISNNPTRYMSVDMESWEEDGCGGDNDYNDDCWFNDDDAHNGRFRLADIDFRIDPPGVYNQYGWYYGGYGYGARVDVLYTCDDAGDGVAFGTDSWRGYAYDGTSLSGTYYGYMTESENFDQSFGDYIINSEYHPTSCRSFRKETFSVRYKMRKTVTECGYYTIRAGSDDGLRLYVDGTLVIDSWIDRGYTVDQAGVYLEPGTHDFVLEYYENGGGNRISFNIQRADQVPTAGNTDITACCADLYDAGGSGNYNNNWDGTTTIYPSDPASILIINGTQITESGYDFLRIYDGAGTGGTLLHDASGTATISNITASSPGGALTVRFTSDVSVTLPGFDLDVSCCLPSNAPTGISGPTELCSGESAMLSVSGGSLGDGADFGNRPLGARTEQQRRFGRPHAVRFAIEQLAAEIPFEPGDRLGQRGLRQVDHPRRARHRSLRHRRGEGGDVPDIQKLVDHAVRLANIYAPAYLCIGGARAVVACSDPNAERPTGGMDEWASWCRISSAPTPP